MTGVQRILKMPPSILALILTMISGCDGGGPAPMSHLAMLDYWPEQQLLFVASRHSGTVDVLRFAQDRGQTAPEHVERLEHPSRNAVVRLVVDRTRGRLWVADHGAVYIYHFASRAPETVIALPRQRFENRVHDLSIDDKGNGYVHTRSGSLIYRIDAQTLQAEPWLELLKPPIADAGFQFAIRVLHTPDQRHLLFQEPKYARLSRINIASGDIVAIRMAPPVELRCALLFWTDEWSAQTSGSPPASSPAETMKAIDCLGRWTASIKLNADRTHATAVFDPQPR